MTQPTNTYKDTHKEALTLFVNTVDKMEVEPRIKLSLAYCLAEKAHKGQYRKQNKTSQAPKQEYIIHPTRVMLILALEVGETDPALLAAALLHDVIEDGEGRVTLVMIKKQFGEEAADYVNRLTKPEGELDGKLSPEQDHAYHELIANSCIQVRLAKLADRIDNLRNALKLDDVGFQKKQLAETRQYFLPLAKKTNSYMHAELLRLCDELAARTA